ncbi:uncharacterized protein LOC136028693 [Artemia franciscana]|uniref:uncharacterized protein LOC136028693 n=1 Tax=Artemia franciscana TaxID=6661 RepID=UPI0032DAF7A4
MKFLILFVFTVIVILNENGGVLCTNQNFQSGGHGIRFSSQSLAPTAYLVTFGVLPFVLLLLMFFNPVALKTLLIERPKIKYKQGFEDTMTSMDKPWEMSFQTEVPSFKTNNTPEELADVTKEEYVRKRRRRNKKFLSGVKSKIQRGSNFKSKGTGMNLKTKWVVTSSRRKQRIIKSKDQALRELDLLLKPFVAGKQKTSQGANEEVTISSNATVAVTISPQNLTFLQNITYLQNLTSSDNTTEVEQILDPFPPLPKTMDIINLFWQPIAPVLFALCFAAYCWKYGLSAGYPEQSLGKIYGKQQENFHSLSGMPCFRGQPPSSL